MPSLPAGPSRGAAIRLRTPELRMLSAAAKRSSVSASSTSADCAFSATSCSRLRECSSSPFAPGRRRLAARSSPPPYGRLRKMTASSGPRWAKARSSTSSSSSSSESDPARARCTSFSSLRRPADSFSAAASSSEAERSTIVSEEALRASVWALRGAGPGPEALDRDHRLRQLHEVARRRPSSGPRPAGRSAASCCASRGPRPSTSRPRGRSGRAVGTGSGRRARGRPSRSGRRRANRPRRRGRTARRRGV